MKDKIIKIFKESLDTDNIFLKSRLKEDLEIDYTDSLEILSEIEILLDIEISGYEWEKLFTIKQIVQCVEEKMVGKSLLRCVNS